MSKLLKETLDNIRPLDTEASQEAQKILDGLLKPPGSLGRLEELAVKLAGIYGQPRPKTGDKAIIMMAGDNGIYEEGYIAYAQEITTLLVELAEAGMVGVSVLARHAGSRLVLVDLGLKGEAQGENIIRRKVRAGTGNIARGPAMTREEAVQAIETGIEVTQNLINEGVALLGTGEVGIGNTSTSAAITAALLGLDPGEVVGIGTGAEEDAYRRKTEAVRRALTVNKPNPEDALDVLSKVGGLEIAGMVGCYLAAAAERKPIVMDGFIAGAAALLAVRLHPTVRDYILPSHLSAEKGAQAVLRGLGMEPYLLMNMRLGEGTGAALAFHLVDAACKIINEMGSFADLAL